ncbi:hypothetical protein Val02_18110 [Virgisporangium aliadipatigenens]|uniref:Uncharacterized protein n=1 Tax=Virgisporangium aliadipatigenens TaxID=741659 RepID=A0A8J3YJ63_9ACTN|nr:hypothetical protein [Virgisporangium aliadipatigenens]GIJ44925.1 hypothetical protein Val02_18110 [Virgisporangium aliadipatigenens]
MRPYESAVACCHGGAEPARLGDPPTEAELRAVFGPGRWEPAYPPHLPRHGMVYLVEVTLRKRRVRGEAPGVRIHPFDRHRLTYRLASCLPVAAFDEAPGAGTAAQEVLIRPLT